jgi:hypothetical protein
LRDSDSGKASHRLFAQASSVAVNIVRGEHR